MAREYTKKLREKFQNSFQAPITKKIDAIFFTKEVQNNLWSKLHGSLYGPSIILFGIIMLIFSMFSIYIIIALCIICLGIFIISLRMTYIIKKKGLIYYLPDNFKRILLSRSLFDLLCDFWYIDSLKQYFKAIFSPLIFKSDPEAAIKNLSHLEHSDRKIFLTKGQIFILPKNCQKFFLSKRVAENLGVEGIIYDDPGEYLEHNKDSMINSPKKNTQQDKKLLIISPTNKNDAQDEILTNKFIINLDDTKNLSSNKNEHLATITPRTPRLLNEKKENNKTNISKDIQENKEAKDDFKTD